MARKRARKAQQQPTRKNSKTKDNWTNKSISPLRLPNKVSPATRFLASLLLSSLDDIVATDRWSSFSSDVCNRAGVPLPSQLNTTDHDKYQFFAMRASLVLEEARCVIAEALSEREQRRKRPIDAIFLNAKNEKHGFASLIFGKKSRNSYAYGGQKVQLDSFTPSEMANMKPGCVLALSFHDSSGVKKSILTSIVPSPDFDDRTVALTAYRMDDLDGILTEATAFQLIPTTNLISEQRQFIACFCPPKVEFLPKLMGMKSASHLRFTSDSDSDGDENSNEQQEDVHEERDNEEKKMDESDEMASSGPGDNEISMTSMDIPSLNPTQEKAASSFIEGPSQNLSLVQGPPGTGKTTFMTAVLCRTFLINYSPKKRYCTIDREKRVLVAAPTNKAISVLASRFLRATKGNGDTGLNAVLIGVEDALFPRDEGGGEVDETHRSLRSIFVYSWVDEIVKDLETLRFDTDSIPTLEAVEEVITCAQFLVQKMKRGLPHLSKKYGAFRYGTTFLKCLEVLRCKMTGEMGKSIQVTSLEISEDANLANDMLGRLIGTFAEMRSGGDCIVSELLATANIIFVTLTSSGVSIMKRTRRIHGESTLCQPSLFFAGYECSNCLPNFLCAILELFVDEAAAATEPEIFIPLHLRPWRMLCVGDPKQLPASVTSQRAANFGLDKSLLDRLMFGCGKEHVMLNIQYRMAPPISEFPSTMFYDDKLSNGSNVISPLYKSNISVLNEDPYAFIQVNGQESRAGTGSYYNMEEARVIVRLVELIRDTSRSCNVESWGSREKLRIITFYSGQVNAIKSLLRPIGLGHVMVATVDSSQGCESDIVIVSFVRCKGVSSAASSSRSVGFLSDNRRINVAITRAKFKLFCVGDAQNTLLRSNSATLTNLAKDAMRRNLMCSQETLSALE